jgi:hypothetical protein
MGNRWRDLRRAACAGLHGTAQGSLAAWLAVGLFTQFLAWMDLGYAVEAMDLLDLSLPVG